MELSMVPEGAGVGSGTIAQFQNIPDLKTFEADRTAPAHSGGMSSSNTLQNTGERGQL